MRLTLYGLMNVRSDILDELHLPASIDRDDLINVLYLKSWDLELVYPFPDFMKTMVGSWSAAHLWGWQKTADALALKYNPIWNKDGTITETEKRNTEGNTSSSSRSDTVSESIGQTNAFNGGAFQDREKATGTDGTVRADSGKSTGSENITRTRVEQGNIGVMSTQSMLREELELDRFSLYERIAEDFVKAFCIQVY